MNSSNTNARSRGKKRQSSLSYLWYRPPKKNKSVNISQLIDEQVPVPQRQSDSPNEHSGEKSGVDCQEIEYDEDNLDVNKEDRRDKNKSRTEITESQVKPSDQKPQTSLLIQSQRAESTELNDESHLVNDSNSESSVQRRDQPKKASVALINLEKKATKEEKGEDQQQQEIDREHQYGKLLPQVKFHQTIEHIVQYAALILA